MRNYIILNDINSNTINGLLIQELPPISKPKMRTRTEEIDGRAGDIVTQLGFKAYDKTIKIGLYGDFDINEVISYFNSSGQVVFSNEPDKYYNYQIVDQIDYERLIRFRTAKVKMHVQPFKYPTEEEPLVGQYQYVTNTGSNMSLDNTANALFKKFDLKGNTSQNGTPTPSSPIPVNVVSGDNEIIVNGSNFITFKNMPTITQNGVTTTPNNSEIKFNGTTTQSNPMFDNQSLGIKLPQGTYTLTFKISSGSVNRPSGDVAFYLRKGVTSSDNIATITLGQILRNNNTYSQTFTIGSDVSLYLYAFTNTANIVFNNTIIQVQLSKGTSTTYEPYIGSSYPIYLGVENYLPITLPPKSILNGITIDYDSESGFISISGTATAVTNFVWDFEDVKLPSTTYVQYENDFSNSNVQVLYFSNGTQVGGLTFSGLNRIYNLSSSLGGKTINRCSLYIANGTTISGKFRPMITQYSTIQKYNPYGTTPIELCKIGTYQDYIYKENGSWYLHKEIGKVVLTGASSETWTVDNTYNRFASTNVLTNYKIDTRFSSLCNYYVYGDSSAEYYFALASNGIMSLFHKPSGVSSVDEWKTWLSSHNVIVYYVLETPTTTLIENSTLIEQLEELKNATSYEGQTNISHDSNDAPFLVDVSAVQSGTDELVVDNEGNIYSRPTLDLEGTGIVNVYLEGNQMFQVDLTDTNEIVIDTDEMEAYNPTTQALMNRQVTGNYDNFKLNVGDNTLKFSGDLTKATVTNYVRWL